jgi:hypothetical protein
MSSITRKTPTTKKKGNGSAKAGKFVAMNSPARRTRTKSKPAMTEEVTLRAFRKTYDRLHPRKAA